MANTNHRSVGKALELLRAGLAPFVERELRAQHGKYWITTVTACWRAEVTWRDDADSLPPDAALLLRLMWEQWNETFRRTLGHAACSLVGEMREFGKRWVSPGESPRQWRLTCPRFSAAAADRRDWIAAMRVSG